MSLRQDYEIYLEKQKHTFHNPMGEFIWKNQESRYMKPFQIYGNLYYVGDSWVCVHLIDTGDGLILLDAGNCGATAMLIQAIWEAGFNPADVKWLILSHGHVDHIGAASFFQKMFGTKLYLGAPDAEMFRTKPELSLIQESTNYADRIFIPDVEIGDGDVMTFGNTEIQFYLVPGHTAGCIACFFDVTDGKENKRAGYYGGFGFNTLKKEYLTEIGDTSYQLRSDYLESLKKVRDERVDIYVGNHTNNNQMLNKRQFMLEHMDKNPFIDSAEWGKYLDLKRDELMKFINDPANM